MVSFKAFDSYIVNLVKDKNQNSYIKYESGRELSTFQFR